MASPKIKSTLTDVPETMLWTLYNRALEAMRDDGIIQDEKAIEICNAIYYDYEANFGTADCTFAIRSVIFDREISKFLEKYPDGTIVNLGEGLETQRFRFTEERALWLTIDLPEAIRIREQFIQADERHLHIAMSALDRRWFDSVPQDKPVFITAQGLFMYLSPEDVESLVRDITNTFDRGYLMFDTVPRWLSRKTMSARGWQKTKSYTIPPMPWGINRNEIRSTLSNWVTNAEEILDLGYDNSYRGLIKWVFWFVSSFPFLYNNIMLSIVKLSFRNTSKNE